MNSNDFNQPLPFEGTDLFACDLALKAAVERHLRSHPQVESQRLGEGREGGRGVTVARLR